LQGLRLVAGPVIERHGIADGQRPERRKPSAADANGLDVAALYDKLEQVVLPLYYHDERERWTAVMKGAIAKAKEILTRAGERPVTHGTLVLYETIYIMKDAIEAIDSVDPDAYVNGYRFLISDPKDADHRPHLPVEAHFRMAHLERDEVVHGLLPESLIENALDITAVINSDGTVRYISPSLEKVLGYKSGGLAGQSPFGLMHPDDLQMIRDLLVQIRQNESFVSPIEVRIRHKNGSFRSLEVVAVNLLDDPIMAGIVVNARDITERKRLEDQFLQAQKMEAIGRLAGGIAHDFNNILTVITGYTELLLSQFPDTQNPQHQDIEHIRKAAERAASLTHQLLAFSRRQVLQPQIISLNTVIAGIENMLQRLIGEDIELVINLDEALGSVRADHGQIEQVILNLAVNARDAMPHGGVLTIETKNVNIDKAYAQQHPHIQVGRYVMLAISDTGIGIEPVIEQHIFEPFFTTKEQGQGTGLGLATVHGIITQSGGYIAVSSQPGQSTTFQVYLPQIATTANPVNLKPIATQSLQGTETILVVEDEIMVRELARRTLVGYGYTVLAARHGMEALQICEQYQEPLHLLLTDLVMPGGLSGHQVAEHIVAKYPDIRILYISGYSNDALVTRGALELDAAFLQKPFTPQALAQKVREVLDSSSNRQQV